MSRYAAAHASPNGAGDARPTAIQILEDENLIGKLPDKVMLVTGISSGIGIETLRAFHATGAHVFGTVRNVAKGQAVVDKILASKIPSGGPITLIEMSLDNLESVRKGAKDILSKTDKLNIVVNNAGIMACPYGKTVDGFETQFATNHLGHFLLFNLLKDTLLASATPDFPSRVVSVSSIGHRAASVRLDDYNFEKEGSYSPWAGYGQSKTANIWLANYIDRHYGPQNLHATSLHPGGINTGLQVHQQELVNLMKDNPEWVRSVKSSEQGASTSVYAALSEEWKNKGGRFLADCEEQLEVGKKPTSAQAASAAKGAGHIPNDDGYKSWAYDKDGEERLWKDSLKMVGLE
ncbi:short-chain dehydrogenase [Mytilinidion resinicola]|uniref:Short-chain dehydrogenase n=1 Tax=Mytilinidion resinicola TaxID=574789 RepID=A0A6A6YUD6_9PEZI|nr:short-chain dehydrogenase [Mytilinidion resinicola]KAF2812370.1 short-chain dehydrogenase [Mytilinidion resinicola]